MTDHHEHELKTHPEPFAATLGRRKLYEIRKDDRHYHVGDVLILEEWNPETEKYTGRSMRAEVTYKTDGGKWGLPPDICVLGIEPFHYQAKP